MSVEVSIICDICGTVAAADKTAARARSVVRDQGGSVGLRNGLDVCPDCRALPDWQTPLQRWRVDSGLVPPRAADEVRCSHDEAGICVDCYHGPTFGPGERFGVRW